MERHVADIAATGDSVRAATREETVPVALGAMVLGLVALIVCFARGYVLLYGDAVAHLAIARRIFDSRNPGLAQLGGVWLPLPHLLMLPFVQKMAWWQNGLAGAWPSLACYVLAVAGLFRLARRVMPPVWALVATAFFGLNPNLLYLATTAMTEPLFLALLIWLTLLTMEFTAELAEAERAGQEGLDAGPRRLKRARAGLGSPGRKLVGIGGLILAAVLTRYDGWVLGAAVWCVVAWQMGRARTVRGRLMPVFGLFTLLALAGPLLWLGYNQHFFHDPLDFLRGPYSAAAIEKKTAVGPNHYRGWHQPAWGLVLYSRTAQLDASVWETGFGVMAAAVMGMVLVVRGGKRAMEPGLAWAAHSGGAWVAGLLWMPLPFYVYSMGWGSVPIFVPQLWPHSFYNSRYGMELLPALAVFAFVAMASWQRRLARAGEARGAVVARLMPAGCMALVAASSVGMMYQVPLVLQEAVHNSATRVALEMGIAQQIGAFPAGAPILMYTSDHVGALQRAGIALRQTLNEGDYDTWSRALAAPAERAAYVVAVAGDPVSAAVAAHPGGLTELTVLCTTGQPCVRVYRSEEFRGR